ncbi:hypothetical protein D5S17_21620 [Pseudonocardiaceae bacterium YIM PH 21723]|nr:hypothetical protein D5S17_21620 [Pseudonocardiaceae bacterium YIM PH 21723]
MTRSATSDFMPLHTGFDRTFRGYDRGQVDRYVSHTEAELRLVTADRNACAVRIDELNGLLSAEREQVQNLTGALDRMVRTPLDPDVLDERMARVVALANDEAREITTRAQTAAEFNWATAERAADDLKAEYEQQAAELAQRKHQMAGAYRVLMQHTQSEVDSMTRQAELRRNRLDQQAAQRHAQVESDFKIAMDERRATALAELAQQRAEAEAEAERLVREATEESARRVAEARREVGELQELREQLKLQLQAMKNTLSAVAPMLQPIEDELETEKIEVPRQLDRVTGDQRAEEPEAIPA